MADINQMMDEFHSLGGHTIPEHKKNFNHYLKKLLAAPLDQNEYFKKLEPKNRQEEIFRVKLLGAFKRWTDLLAIVQEGDRILSKLAIRELDIKTTFETISAREFVDKICPNLSFVNRKNLIHKLSFIIDDAVKGIDYYEVVLEKYGLRVAIPLLKACSEDYIMKVKEEHGITFKSRELIFLHKKYPKLEVQSGRFDDDVYLNYLCQHDMKRFEKLLEHNCPRLGKRLFLRYLKHYKASVIKDPSKITLYKELVYRYLNHAEFYTFFKNLLSCNKDVWQFRSIVLPYLKFLPLEKRGDFLFSAFKEVRGFQIYEDKTYMQADLLNELTLSDRLKFDLQDQFVVYKDAKSAIAIIRDKIDLTANINTRINYVNMLIETCNVNNDMKSLLEVLNYVKTRHKNDSSGIRKEVLYKMSNWKYEKFNPELWPVIIEILDTVEANKERIYGVEKLYENIIVYLIENNKDYLKTLKALFKSTNLYYRDTFKNKPEYFRQCLIQYPELIEELFPVKDDLKQAKLQYLNAIIEFSKKHPNLEISMYYHKDYLFLLLEQYQENKFRYGDSLMDILESKPKNSEEQKIYDIFFQEALEGIKTHYCERIFKWLFKKDPDLVADAGKAILSSLSGDQTLYEISKAHYLKINKNLSNDVLEIVKNADNESFSGAVKYLSFLGTKDYISMAENFGTSTDVMQSYKNFKKPYEVVPLILKYCHGDYLQHSLEPLYFCLKHSPEHCLSSAILTLSTQAVSVRKHAVHLSFLIAPLEVTHTVMTSMCKTEKNKSVKKYTIAKIFKLFVTNRTEKEWKLLKDNIHFLDCEDDEGLGLVRSFNQVPYAYYGQYSQLLWEYFKGFGKNKEYDLISYFRPDDLSLNAFYVNVILSTLFNEVAKSSSIEQFVYKYIVLSEIDINQRIDFILKLINDHALKSSQESYEFLKSVLHWIAHGDKDKLQIARKSIDIFIEKIDTIKLQLGMFELKLILDYYKHKMNCGENAYKELAIYILNVQRSTFQNYGAEIFPYFLDFLTNHIIGDYYFGEYSFKSKCLVVGNILKIDKSSVAKIMCLKILPKLEQSNPLEKEVFEKVIEEIKKDSDAIVKIYLDDFLL